ncbi:Thiamine diphosphokinase [Candidatus Roizmanbacteria bacterium]|nr:Thiamine diphosphokinase [Candidatus Roizmanbacteria bacterium]
MKRAIVFVNGNLSNLSQAKKIVKKTDCLIAVDGGAKHILKLGLTPQIIIGDFDSTPKNILKNIGRTQRSAPTKIIKYPRKKNKTDFELAIDLCLKRKFKEIIIFGILGNRIDHMIANIFLITKIQTENQTIKIKIIEGKKEIYILNKEITINGKIGEEVSIIPISEKLEGITTEGLEYQLENKDLIFGSTRGISNVMNKKITKIFVKKGVALIEHNTLATI